MIVIGIVRGMYDYSNRVEANALDLHTYLCREHLII